MYDTGFEKRYGFANKSANTPNNVDTKFNPGYIHGLGYKFSG